MSVRPQPAKSPLWNRSEKSLASPRHVFLHSRSSNRCRDGLHPYGVPPLEDRWLNTFDEDIGVVIRELIYFDIDIHQRPSSGRTSSPSCKVDHRTSASRITKSLLLTSIGLGPSSTINTGLAERSLSLATAVLVSHLPYLYVERG